MAVLKYLAMKAPKAPSENLVDVVSLFLCQPTPTGRGVRMKDPDNEDCHGEPDRNADEKNHPSVDTLAYLFLSLSCYRKAGLLFKRKSIRSWDFVANRGIFSGSGGLSGSDGIHFSTVVLPDQLVGNRGRRPVATTVTPYFIPRRTLFMCQCRELST